MKTNKSNFIRISFIIIMISLFIYFGLCINIKDILYYIGICILIFLITYSFIYNFTLTNKEINDNNESGDFMCDC